MYKYLVVVLILNAFVSVAQKSADYYFQEGNNCMNVIPGTLTPERVEQCILEFSKAIKINSKFWHAYRNRGRAYFFLKKYKEAYLDFNKAISLADKRQNPDLFTWRGQCLYELKYYQKAIRDFDYSIPLITKSNFIYLCRAKAKWKLGLKKEACVDYNMAIRGSPEYRKSIDFIECN